MRVASGKTGSGWRGTPAFGGIGIFWICLFRFGPWSLCGETGCFRSFQWSGRCTVLFIHGHSAEIRIVIKKIFFRSLGNYFFQKQAAGFIGKKFLWKIRYSAFERTKYLNEFAVKSIIVSHSMLVKTDYFLLGCKFSAPAIVFINVFLCWKFIFAITEFKLESCGATVVVN